MIENVKTDAHDKPLEDVIIVDCGQLYYCLLKNRMIMLISYY